MVAQLLAYFESLLKTNFLTYLLTLTQMHFLNILIFLTSALFLVCYCSFVPIYDKRNGEREGEFRKRVGRAGEGSDVSL